MLKIKSFLFLLVLLSQKIVFTADQTNPPLLEFPLTREQHRQAESERRAACTFSYFPVTQEDVSGIIALVRKNFSLNDPATRIKIDNPYNIDNAHLQSILPDFFAHVINIRSKADFERLRRFVATAEKEICKYYPAGTLSSLQGQSFRLSESYSAHLLNPDGDRIILSEDMYQNEEGQPLQGWAYLRPGSSKTILVARLDPDFIRLSNGLSAGKAIDETQNWTEAQQRKVIAACALGAAATFAALDITHRGVITKGIVSALIAPPKFCYEKIVVPYANCSSYVIRNSFWYCYGKPLTFIGKALFSLTKSAINIFNNAIDYFPSKKDIAFSSLLGVAIGGLFSLDARKKQEERRRARMYRHIERAITNVQGITPQELAHALEAVTRHRIRNTQNANNVIRWVQIQGRWLQQSVFARFGAQQDHLPLWNDGHQE